MVRNLFLLILFVLCLCSISNAQVNVGNGSVLDAYQYNYINSASTTVVKSGAGILKGLVVTGGSAGTIVVYNNIIGSGPVISNFDSTNAIANYPLNIVFSSGCTVVTSAATKITVSYI